MNKFLPVSGLAAAATTAFFALASAPAQAACISSNNPCDKFDPLTIKNPDDPIGTSGIGGFSGTQDLSGPSFVRINIAVSGFTGSAFTLSNFKYIDVNNTTPFTAFGPVNVPGKNNFLGT